ncbi:vacuolar protein sorting-associated protein 33B [Microplitis demolitor]|uniref:vacuolar protein sorting-associated protein 33B n=1 Tax=Microplitis demolitor TaxID=69319 RepID=UPI0004CCCE66|nr:vacuolar protein sorting-associated protein 33B [Microplitis demolitor]
MDITFDDKLNALQQISQRKFVDILDMISGKKDLIIEQILMKPLDSFVGVTVLKKHGVDKIYKLEPGIKPTNSQRVFLVSSDLISCKRVLDQIQSEISQSEGLNFHILINPHIPTVVHSLIEEEGLADLVTVRALSWELIRIDDNVLSLETPIFVDLYYHKDTSLLSSLARSLWSLQLILGWPKFTMSFGKHSDQVLKMIDAMQEDNKSINSGNEIGGVIIMDRSYDLVSTLLTPVSYLGLLSEVAPINVNTATIDKSQIKLDPKKDKVYEDVRDIHFSDVFPKLRATAKSLKSEQEATQEMKLAEMGHYVATRLSKTAEVKRLLASHISACEAIISALGSEFESLQSTEKSILECVKRKECLDYIERNIIDYPMRSLRLLCLLSITSGGLTSNESHVIQKSHLHAHGYENIPLFYKLETCGFLRQKKENLLNKLPTWSGEWTSNAQRMKLLPNQSKKSDDSTACPSYVFSGAYIPAIAQFLKTVVAQTSNPKAYEELINLPECQVNRPRTAVQPKIVIVCIVGGITYGEISACRFIEKSMGIKLAIVSDCLLTSDKLFKSIQEA